MSQQIWKYHLPAGQEAFSLDLPRGAMILNVDANPPGSERVAIWVLIEMDNPKVPHHFLVVPTGKTFSPNGKEYVGTFQVPTDLTTDTLVFHLFTWGG